MENIIYCLIFAPMLGAAASYMIGRKSKKCRNYFVCGVTALESVLAVLLLWQYIAGADAAAQSSGPAPLPVPAPLHTAASLPGVCGMGLAFAVDGFRAAYVCIAAFMWLGATLFSLEYMEHYRNRNRYYLSWLITLGATAGIFLSADLYTTFIFFEVMSFSSYVWVAQDERQESLRAALTYLAVSVTGGMVMLMGLFLLYHQAGTLEIDRLYEACQGKNVYGAGFCLLFGFGAKAGVFPLHFWLPKAHPVAPAPASALLSGILTKTGIFGVLVVSCKIFRHDGRWGTYVLALGVVTMVIGGGLALLSADLKRALACSSVSQIGFIMLGIGMQGLLGEENGLAVRGTFLHMVNHSLFKLVLFLAAGVIYKNLHKLDLNEIRGFGRKKPLLALCFLMGAMGIGGVPLFSGYISKTALHESIVEYAALLAEDKGAAALLSAGGVRVIEWIFIVSGGLTVAYMAKLFIAVFVEKNSNAALQEQYDARRKYMSPLSAAVLLTVSLLFPVMGILPGPIMDKLADLGQGFMEPWAAGGQVSYFSMGNLSGSLISMAIGAFLYAAVVREWTMRRTEDGGRVYLGWQPKAGIAGAVAGVLIRTCMAFAGLFDTLTDAVVVLLRKTVYRDRTKAGELQRGNGLTYFLGSVANGICRILNCTFWRKSPKETDYRHKLALDYWGIRETVYMITRSLSYGLILFSIGLCATLLYLLVGAVR